MSTTKILFPILSIQKGTRILTKQEIYYTVKGDYNNVTADTSIEVDNGNSQLKTIKGSDIAELNPDTNGSYRFYKGGKKHQPRKGSLDACTVAELKAKAVKRGISLEGLTKKCDIIAKIRR